MITNYRLIKLQTTLTTSYCVLVAYVFFLCWIPRQAVNASVDLIETAANMQLN